MTYLFTIAAFVVALGVLITFHELGHYCIARLAGVRVLRFSIGFGQPLWKKVLGKDRTEWVIGAIPLGGYVKMLDERDSESEVTPAEVGRAFNRQSVWRRFAIVVAGPVANFILAIVLYSAVFMIGVQELKPIIAEPPEHTAAARAELPKDALIVKINDEPVATWQDVRWKLLQLALAKAPARLEMVNPKQEISWHQLDLSGLNEEDLDGDVLRRLGLLLYRPEIAPVIDSVVPDSVAERGGLLSGDRIVSIDGRVTDTWDQVVDKIRRSPNTPIGFLVERNRQNIALTLAPEAVEQGGATIGRIGATPKIDLDAMRHLVIEVRFGPFESVPRAVEKTWDTSVFSTKMLLKMFTGGISWHNISGPVTIANYAGQSARLGVAPYLNFLALISISLGILNLLPVPLLDGGNLMYYVVEIVRGRPVSERALEIGQQVGLFLLLTLMAFAFYNDISRLLSS
jgi:regulator of sigma E protease